MTERDSTPQPRVKVIGAKHPHRGEYGRWTGEVRTLLGKPLGLVKLENCKHGTDACYVSPTDIRQVNEDDQYV